MAEAYAAVMTPSETAELMRRSPAAVKIIAQEVKKEKVRGVVGAADSHCLLVSSFRRVMVY
jgi:hypothetical protein